MLPADLKSPPQWSVDPRDPARLRLSGRWTLRYAHEIGERLREMPDGARALDATGVDRLDSAGVLQLLRHARRRELDFADFAFRDDHRALVDTIEDVHEPFMLRLGFMDRTPQGRIVTDLGRAHLSALGYEIPPPRRTDTGLPGLWDEPPAAEPPADAS